MGGCHLVSRHWPVPLLWGSPSRIKPYNTTLVSLGTTLIWLRWFRFNGGSALNASVRAMLAAFNTNTTAYMGVIGGVLVDYIKPRGKFSIVGGCGGAITGLVGIMPAAGFISVWLTTIIGTLIGFLTSIWLHIDEGIDIFKLHGIGGMGGFLT
ncbi:hypothetical protein N7491_009565 [Penicillium cf. griseofulvum]|uniref:Ammonium transporter AmtB-like domain-containing protein n=1 Tax=Penicillium cf. griseofulvum TaxID=2972120 RepID=A0A9W9JNI5_9EURO|nr:hypothetical protein N7472_004841 [Penicillium cf. griseofulvum]KAJ5424349.1 hypothetical protein N7491_009565 [Penicillium cf. griseofulvum]KAJ5442409.1 hypothetical protein N7445_005416 [Penicillium cf. griseofulvum]